MNFKIGVIADSFKLPIRDALKKAKQIGADGVQLYAVTGEVSPDVLNKNSRAELKQFIASLGLEISALCGDLGGHGFSNENENREKNKIEMSKKIVDLAVDLGTRIVTTHIGVVPQDKSKPAYKTMRDACRELGKYAHKKGTVFAIETGPETARELYDFLIEVNERGIGVNLDPANLVMVTGDDPVRAVDILKPYIVHTHAKDGIKLAPSNAAEVYNAFAEGGIEGFDFGKLFSEVPLGQGQVKWAAYLDALKKIGYSGYLTIERETGADPGADIQKAVDFLRELNI